MSILIVEPNSQVQLHILRERQYQLNTERVINLELLEIAGEAHASVPLAYRLLNSTQALAAGSLRASVDGGSSWDDVGTNLQAVDAADLGPLSAAQRKAWKLKLSLAADADARLLVVELRIGLGA